MLESPIVLESDSSRAHSDTARALSCIFSIAKIPPEVASLIIACSSNVASSQKKSSVQIQSAMNAFLKYATIATIKLVRIVTMKLKRSVVSYAKSRTVKIVQTIKNFGGAKSVRKDSVLNVKILRAIRVFGVAVVVGVVAAFIVRRLDLNAMHCSTVAGSTIAKNALRNRNLIAVKKNVVITVVKGIIVPIL